MAQKLLPPDMNAPPPSNEGLSIVIPVYNSAGIVPELIRRLEKALPQLSQHYEAVLVNDASTDHGWQVIMQQAATRPWIRGISLARNCGQNSALLAGLQAARYDRIVTMDDDLQHAPEEIGLLLAELNKGYDVVYGIPPKRMQGWARNCASAMLYWITQNIFKVPSGQKISAFRALRGNLRANIRIRQGSQPFLHLLLAHITSNIGTVSVTCHNRFSGHSSYSLSKMVLTGMFFICEARAWKKTGGSFIAFSQFQLPISHKVNL